MQNKLERMGTVFVLQGHNSKLMRRKLEQHGGTTFTHTLYCQEARTISLAARSLARRTGSSAAILLARSALLLLVLALLLSSLLLVVGVRELLATWKRNEEGGKRCRSMDEV